jgi:hypothetical protein
MIRMALQNVDGSAICRSGRRLMQFPLINVGAEAVRVQPSTVRIRYDDSAHWAADWCPDDIGAGIGSNLVVDNNRYTLGETEVTRIVRKTVIDRIVDAVRARVAPGILVDDHPLLDRRNEGENGHAGARNILVIGDIIDRGIPVYKIPRDLMRQLLAVVGIALIRVVADELVVVEAVETD